MSVPLTLLLAVVTLSRLSVPAAFAAEAVRPPRAGEQIYQDYCVSCHGGGWQGAPVTNDKRDWETRLANGADALLRNAREGINGMPPLGTCMDCSDDELKAAILEMLKF